MVFAQPAFDFLQHLLLELLAVQGAGGIQFGTRVDRVMRAETGGGENVWNALQSRMEPATGP